MKKLALSLIVVSTLAFSGQGDHNSELSLTVGGAVPSGDLELKDYLNMGLRYGRHIDNSFINMVELGYERGVDAKYENSAGKTDVNRFFINAVKEHDINKDFAFYGLAGIGYQDFTTEMYDNKDDGFVHFGVGAKYWVTDYLALKAEIREEFDFGLDRNFIYSLGFTIPFGKKAQDVPVKSEPVVVQEEVKPIVKEEPKPKPVVVKEVSNDNDNDGVLNENDICPKTLPKKVVDENGCLKIVRLHVNFEYNKFAISQSYMPEIKKVVNFMKENSNYSVAVDGHTDAQGSEEYNLALSLRRANAVANEMIKQGIDKQKISVKGFGETNPIATNKTKDGRAQNRRVDTSFSK